MPSKRDFKKEMKQFYQPPTIKFVEVDLPELWFVMIDGSGDPNTNETYPKALEWLYSTSYAMKFASKKILDRDYVVPPLEGLWWADDPADFVTRNKDAWKWTMMIMVPEFVTQTMFETATKGATKKLGEPPHSLRRQTLCEGLCLQTMFIGSYDDEGPTLAHLHNDIMPERQYTFNGPHHEIYIGDPRRVHPSRLKTVLRQPVKSIEADIASQTTS